MVLMLTISKYSATISTSIYSSHEYLTKKKNERRDIISTQVLFLKLQLLLAEIS